MDISNESKGVARHWGARTPMMAVAECGELIQAICHVERAFDNRPDIHDTYAANMEQLIDAMGDMCIAMVTLKQYYRIPQFKIDMRIDKKLSEMYDKLSDPIFERKDRE